jgi:hypothetical protein
MNLYVPHMMPFFYLYRLTTLLSLSDLNCQYVNVRKADGIVSVQNYMLLFEKMNQTILLGH